MKNKGNQGNQFCAHSKVHEFTRTYSNVHKYVISSFRLCFLLIFCKSGAGVE